VNTAAADRFPELAPFVAAVCSAYGDRLAGIYLFGSRARGDHKSDSDYDVAVVLSDNDAVLWREVNRLADLAVETLLSGGPDIQAVPFKVGDWKGRDPQRDLARAARRDAIGLVEPG
jgi:uncharacterized protein